MIKIRLTRLGAKNRPFYRIVVADSRSKRDGRIIEQIGWYDPLPQPSVTKIDKQRASHWLSVGAQPTETVAAMFRAEGLLDFDNQPVHLDGAEPSRLVGTFVSLLDRAVPDSKLGTGHREEVAEKLADVVQQLLIGESSPSADSGAIEADAKRWLKEFYAQPDLTSPAERVPKHRRAPSN